MFWSFTDWIKYEDKTLATGMTQEHSFQINRFWKLLPILFLTCLGTEAHADIYSYEDAGGTMVFTDNPAKTPLRRGKVKRIPDGDRSVPVTSSASTTSTTAKPRPVRKDAPEVNRQNLSYGIGGYTFQDIRREISRRSQMRINNRLAIAWCSWQVDWDIHTRRKDNRCEIDFVETKAKVSITMPRWENYAAADVSMKEAWDLYAGAILKHEETHASHGIAAALEVQRRLSDLSGSSSCTNILEEGALLAGRIIKDHRAMDAEMDRVSGDDFDTITDVEKAGDKRGGVLGRQYPARKNAEPR